MNRQQEQWRLLNDGAQTLTGGLQGCIAIRMKVDTTLSGVGSVGPLATEWTVGADHESQKASRATSAEPTNLISTTQHWPEPLRT